VAGRAAVAAPMVAPIDAVAIAGSVAWPLSFRLRGNYYAGLDFGFTKIRTVDLRPDARICLDTILAHAKAICSAHQSRLSHRSLIILHVTEPISSYHRVAHITHVSSALRPPIPGRYLV
jgi:hypothetical protein